MPRPFVLDPLFRSVTTLPGVGAKNAKLAEKLTGGARVLDLLFHAPIDRVDRSYRPRLAEAEDGRLATLTVTIEGYRPSPRPHLPFRVVGRDASDDLVDLVFFHVRGPWIEQSYPVGGSVIVSGKLEKFQGKWQMVHPDRITDPAELDRVEALYPLTQGLTNRQVNKMVAGALSDLPALPEWLDGPLMKQRRWPEWRAAMTTLHQPASAGDLLPSAPARQRLAYDELLAGQLALAMIREHYRGGRGRPCPVSVRLRPALLKALPFTLTGAQERALADIDSDMVASARMMRLLQGDVGSGKTVVAALAMLNMIEAGGQAALMAPTEILAQQHAQTLMPLFEAIGVKALVLTGRHKGKAREEALAQIASGAAQAVIGTHALFQEDVAFADLGLAVIDEQHRFGVHQRLQLSDKGRGVDVLVMTATPIPRTLTLTAYGDLDVSRLDEKPPGRKPIDTRTIPLPKMAELISALDHQMAAGAQVYWVCPLVEESEVLDLAAATERFEALRQVYGAKVGLVHGRMKAAEKDSAMADFAAGKVRILVATTVIEVGVNVPTATVMVVEHAERFGLSQLHQLRGRVGRGGDQSYCFLLFDPGCTQVARERLKILRQTEDGFLIAERDLQLRGPGDLLGTKQSGLPVFHLADLSAHADLLEVARDDARLILSRDGELEGERGKALRVLLYLFERDQAIKYLRSG